MKRGGGYVSRSRRRSLHGKRLYKNLSFLLSPRGFGATVTAGKLFNAPGGIHKLLFAGEKWMASGTNTDLNIATRGAGVIDRAARAHHVGLVIFWMDPGFHLRNGERNLIARSRPRKV
jgi:hypothetical protein